MTGKPRMLVLSHVLPFPRSSGQQQRVFYSLQAARQFFHVTFASFVNGKDSARTKGELLKICEDAVLLPSVYHSNRAAKPLRKMASAIFSLRTGLKRSN